MVTTSPARLPLPSGEAEKPLMIGLVAPPWLQVPPPAYGGIELAIDVLARGLQQRGHEVILFATGDSTCDVPRAWHHQQADPASIGSSLAEIGHVIAAYERLADCMIVHDHTLVGPFARHLHGASPVVTTNHGPFADELVSLYRNTGAGVPLIAISADQASRAPASVPVSAVIHHGIDLARYSFEARPGRYLAALGRMHPSKGLDTAIDVARRAGMPLLIGAKMQEPAEQEYFASCIRPRLGGDVEYLGELGHAEKVALLAGARALLNPIRWPEPFGLVMIEAMACGTPVIATREGSAPELVTHGITGYAVSRGRLVEAVAAVERIDRRQVRHRVEHDFSMDAVARDHELFYRSVIRSRACGPEPGPVVPVPRPVSRSVEHQVDLR